MKRTARIAIVHALLAALAAAGASAEAPGSAQVLAGLERWLEGTRDMECRFEQRLVSGALGAGAVESGTLKILRPGRMRWDYRKPEAKIAILDGDRTFVYLPSDRQWIRGRLASQGAGLGTLLGGAARVSEVFQATLGSPAPDGDGAYRLKLVPLQPGGGLESVILIVRPPTHAIEAARVLDAAGNVVEYRFSGIRRNRGLPAAAFRFEPPPGTEIVDAE
jgi:outer membrane lipoprotein carrier protein